MTSDFKFFPFLRLNSVVTITLNVKWGSLGKNVCRQLFCKNKTSKCRVKLEFPVLLQTFATAYSFSILHILFQITVKEVLTDLLGYLRSLNASYTPHAKSDFLNCGAVALGMRYVYFCLTCDTSIKGILRQEN